MADRPLSTPLPADLPEDWTSGQIVAPMGADAGLSEQHGYNYLMAAVNAAQRAANAINESFDTISGKRTCRVSVGTSAAGWSQADCDYLCDGTDDQEELTAAINDVYEKGGGEIAVLSGDYNLTEAIEIENKPGALSITGEPGATVFRMGQGASIRFSAGEEAASAVSFSGITFDGSASSSGAHIGISGVSAVIESCIIRDVRTSMNDLSCRVGAVFRDNLVEYKGEAGTSYVVTVWGGFPEGCAISGNRFVVNTGSAPIGGDFRALWVQILDSSETMPTIPVAAITANALSANGANKAEVSVVGEAVLSGNCFINTNVSANSTTIGNIVEGGYIDVRSSGSAVGNTITNGSIYAKAGTLVSGNIIRTESQENAAAIVIGKGGSDAAVDVSPGVTSNCIYGGNVGILLQKNSFGMPEISCALVTGNRIWGCNVPIQIEANWSRCMVTNNMLPEGQSIVDKGEDNIIRGNSDDSSGSSGGGTVAGVASFKGRTGAVVPQSGDYTAAMVGAIPAGTVTAVQAVTQEQYDALAAKGATTLYLIKE